MVLARSEANRHLLFRGTGGSKRLCTSCCNPPTLVCGPQLDPADRCTITRFMWVSLAGIASDCGCIDGDLQDGEWELPTFAGTYLLEAGFFAAGLPDADLLCPEGACSYGRREGCIEGDFGRAVLYNSTDGTCQEGELASQDYILMDIGICFPSLPDGDSIKAQVGIAYEGSGQGQEPDCDELITTVFEGEHVYTSAENCSDISFEIDNDLTCANTNKRINGGSLFMWGVCDPSLSATEWNSASSYAPHNVVTDGGVTYLADASSTNKVPASNPTDWVEI